jgi:hypothetical protein
VDSITASRIANMKELRPPSGGRSEIRILLVFDAAARPSANRVATTRLRGAGFRGVRFRLVRFRLVRFRLVRFRLVGPVG